MLSKNLMRTELLVAKFVLGQVTSGLGHLDRVELRPDYPSYIPPGPIRGPPEFPFWTSALN